MTDTEFQEFVKDAPKFVSMERGELVTCAYAMHAAGVKMEAENAKLRELAVRMFHTIEWSDRMSDSMYWHSFSYKRELRELGIEADE